MPIEGLAKRGKEARGAACPSGQRGEPPARRGSDRRQHLFGEMISADYIRGYKEDSAVIRGLPCRRRML
jgi:hypothetical protein